MRRGAAALAAALLTAAAGCSSETADPADPPTTPAEGPRTELVLDAPAGAAPSVLEDAAAVLAERLDGLYPDTETSVAVVDARLVVEVLDEVDPAALAEVLTIPGRLALRPVLSMDSAAGAGIDPDALPAGLPACAGDPSPGCVDPQTGLTPVPDPDLEALLPSADGGSVYLLGPAALTNHHIAEAVADRGPSGWVVDFGFTAEGEEAFTDVTKRLAGFPVGDPRRGLAIVLDGVVRSAPPIAPDVSPDRGIVGGGGMIALGEADDAATTAFALAAALAVPPLPVDLTVTGD